MNRQSDRDLGLDRPITRRDFVHDLSLAGLALALPLPRLAFATDAGAPYYPPTLTGLRGSHPGAFEVAPQRFGVDEGLDRTGHAASVLAPRPAAARQPAKFIPDQRD